MNTRVDVSRFAIYSQPPSDQKPQKEAGEIHHLLCRLDQFIRLDDVQFGTDPPDFVFCCQVKQIGAELTDLNPKVFEAGGNRARGRFNQWRAEISPDSLPHEFDFGVSTLRESLAAFQGCVSVKRRKATHWCSHFPETWLLMRIGDGSPFGELIAGPGEMEQETEPGMEDKDADYLAKATHGLYAICQDIRPFDYVLLFRKTDLATSICNLLAFPANPNNPHQLPGPSHEVLKRGESASNGILDLRRRSMRVVTIRPFRLGSGRIAEGK